MKKLTKIRIKYLLISSGLCIVLGTVFPTFMRYHISVTAHVVGNTTSQATYTVKFHNNGGTGDMQDMTINYNETKKLTKNTFTRDSYNFDVWNTKPDGTGINYEDEEEINNTTYIEENQIELYAIWTKKVAKANGNYYDTLQAAITDAPTDGTETVVKLLQNVSEKIEISEGKNISLNLQNYTVTNKGNLNVIVNLGTLKISNGTVSTSAASNGAINNEAGGILYITGGRIISTGGRQALYNNGGIVEISENAYLSSSTALRPAVTNNTNTSKITITGGTIISTGQSGIENKGILTLGVKDNTYNSDAFVIKGKIYGINSSMPFSFFDGVFKGKDSPFNDVQKITETEDGYNVLSINLENDENYKTAKLAIYAHTAIVTFNLNGGDSSEKIRILTKGDILGSLPEVTRPGHIFNGWFTELEGGEQVTPNYIVNANTTFYAHWTARDVAKYNNVVYPTITEAINKTPNNTKATITLLEDTDETVSIWKNKNIVIDLNGNKLTNYGIKNAVIKNEGILEIINGNVECLTVNGSIDNEATGTMKISGVTITNSAGRQALYNNGRVC